MPDKFTLEEHQKRMREILKPQPQVGGSLIERIREAAKKRRLPRLPRPGV